MKINKIVIIFQLGLLIATNGFAQLQLELGGSATIEWVNGADDSHFYYNEVHPEKRDGQLSVRELNLLTGVKFSTQFSVHTRILLRQELGNKLDNFQISQAILKWVSKNNTYQISIGRFINPFGRFYQRLLPRDRLFIINPLPYGYYTNISETVGFSSGLHEPNTLNVGNHRDWGLPISYYEGYTNGIKGRWHFWPDTAFVDVAIVHAAPITSSGISNPIYPTLITRVEIHPFFPWRQGFSFSTGSFLQRAPINSSVTNLSSFRQTLLGTDFSLGYAYFELSGELIHAWFQVPEFDQTSESFIGPANNPNRNTLRSLSGYATLKWEMPFWVGSYLAYRYSGMRFSDTVLLSGEKRAWDDHVYRHSIGWGYQISRFLLIKMVLTAQNVQNKNWELNTFHSSLTIHF